MNALPAVLLGAHADASGGLKVPVSVHVPPTERRMRPSPPAPPLLVHPPLAPPVPPAAFTTPLALTVMLGDQR